MNRTSEPANSIVKRLAQWRTRPVFDLAILGGSAFPVEFRELNRAEYCGKMFVATTGHGRMGSRSVFVRPDSDAKSAIKSKCPSFFPVRANLGAGHAEQPFDSPAPGTAMVASGRRPGSHESGTPKACGPQSQIGHARTRSTGAETPDRGRRSSFRADVFRTPVQPAIRKCRWPI